MELMRQSTGYSLAGAEATNGQVLPIQKASPGGGAPFHLQTPSAPMIKPRILRPIFGRAKDEAELMRRSAGRSRGNPKPGRAQNFIRKSPRWQALKDPKKAPRRPRRKCAHLRMSKVPRPHDFRVLETTKEALPCRRASFVVPSLRLFSALSDSSRFYPLTADCVTANRA